MCFCYCIFQANMVYYSLFRGGLLFDNRLRIYAPAHDGGISCDLDG